MYHVPCVTCFKCHPTFVASKNVKFQLSRNSTKFDWVSRFHETNSTIKSVSENFHVSNLDVVSSFKIFNIFDFVFLSIILVT